MREPSPPLEYMNEDPRQYRNETALVDAIREQIEAEYPGAWVFNVHGDPYQSRGVPDLLVAWGGRLVGLEVKHPKKGESEETARYRASVAQCRHIRRLRDAGIVAEVVVAVVEARRVLHKGLVTTEDPDVGALYDTAAAMRRFEEKL